MFVRRNLERALQRRGHRIVDRADQAGDIAGGGRLAAAFGERAARLAFEVDDEDIILGDQHLSEMEIAVMTDVQHADRFGNERVEAYLQRWRLRQQLVDKLPFGVFRGVAALLQPVEYALGA